MTANVDLIISIAPEIESGSGVGGVAHHLEQEWQRMGVRTLRFTLAEARGGWLPTPGPGIAGKLVLLGRVVWFSLVGTVLARRFLAQQPHAVSVCHNDVLAGDVYVNHGILRVAMAARGHYVWRMVRNPLHLFTTVRDRARYHSGVHQAVVSLTTEEQRLLHQTYPRLRPRPAVIGNGVDVVKFAPPTADERVAARRWMTGELGVPADAIVGLFVGHEYDRKGLPLAVEALAGLPSDVHLLVVGGTEDLLAQGRGWAEHHGVGGHVHFAGALTDPRPGFHAADFFTLPSAYEANALVVLEALACGLPVVATPVGYAPEIISDGHNGYLVERTVAALRTAITAVVESEHRDELAVNARESALPHAWSQVARRYLDLLTAVAGSRPAPRSAR
ncbi:MAG: glycosyltransferase family 4 protein [Propionibacteriaceae bacterium]